MKNLQSEAKQLAAILRGMCEGGGEEEGVNIYADDYSPGDGDAFVIRAAQLLEAYDKQHRALREAVSVLINAKGAHNYLDYRFKALEAEFNAGSDFAADKGEQP